MHWPSRVLPAPPRFNLLLSTFVPLDLHTLLLFHSTTQDHHFSLFVSFATATERHYQFLTTKKPELYLTTSTMATFQITSTRAPTHAEIGEFIMTRNSLDIVRIMRGLTEPAAQVAFASTLLLAPPPVVGPNTIPEKVKKVKALNAFVGFRCK
jgi:hypothetical protein